MSAQTSTPTESAHEFDLGPLSWVQGEIGQALARGLDLLAAFGSDPSDLDSLKQARNHVHAAAGAIQMVGLEAVVAYTDEVERQLARLEELDASEVGRACALIDRGCRMLRIFLDELVGGAPPVPLKLYPEYEAMQRSRGIKAVAPTDLFYPELDLRAQVLEPLRPIAQTQLAAHLVKQRRLYQTGLLGFLRGDGEGARMMREAVAGIERASAPKRARVFWWTVGAFFDALTSGGLEPEFGTKQLAARIDLQIRRVVEGSAKVADRLRREVLYYVAISAPIVPSVQAVQSDYGLSGLIPSAEALNADLVRLQPILREAREQLAVAKDLWLKVASGRADSLPKLKESLASMQRNADELGNAALRKLIASLVARLDGLPPSESIPEPMAMEYATGMLLAESAVESFAGLPQVFPKQVEAMLARLDAVQASRPVPAATAPLLDEMFRRAHERVLMAQIAREIQANLRRMEQVLDAFFRDNSKRAELATLGKESAQIRGALRILGEDAAERLLGLCQGQIDGYAQPGTPVGDEDLELLAESLSGLGFFIEALEQQRPDRQRLIAPFLAKRLGEAPSAPADRRGETVEDAVDELRNALPALVAEVHRVPTDAGAREILKARLEQLVDDAKLIDDAELVAQAESALAEFGAGGAAGLTAAVTAIAESGGAAPAAAPTISAETQRLLAADATGLDAELLEIYLAEAAEVLDAVAASRDQLAANPGDREALRTARRQFHTLKGSGRMVGLTELGEIAFDVEKVHNRLLEEELPVTAATVAMIEIAERSFRHWIAALKDTGSVAPDAAELRAAIRLIAAELPPDREPVAAPAEATSSQPATIDLPELGRGPALPAHAVPWIDETEGGGDESAEIIDFSPVGDVLAVPGEGAPVPVDIRIGDVTLSPDLYNVLVDEAQTHLAALEHELSVLELDANARPSAAMVRASHTLCGIHRASGLPLIAATAKALEQCLLALQYVTGPMPELTLPTLADAVRGLRESLGRVRARTAFNAIDFAQAAEIQDELDALRQTATAEYAGLAAEQPEGLAEAPGEITEQPEGLAEAPGEITEQPKGLAEAPGEITEQPEVSAAPPDGFAEQPAEIALPPGEDAAPTVESAREAAATEPVVAQSPISPGLRGTYGPISVPRPPEDAQDFLAGVRDDVDEQVLPIFLEEAAELYPEAGAQVRAWRRSPTDNGSVHELRRTLHTFKGSARMAGAMRLGELAHLMESRLVVGDELAPGTPELFEALDADLDRIGHVLDALREGRTNVALPWATEAREAAEKSAQAGAEAPASAPTAPAAERPVVVPLSASSAPRGAEAGDVDAGARAMLRVRADTIDRLVTEAGEVAITRTQIEGEVRALKANLLELTSSVIRLRAQVRDIEIQAESQIQSRLLQVGEGTEGFDPLEFDRYTRFQELARSLAEGVNDVSTVQQSLLKNADVAEAALIAQARLSRDVQQQLFAIRTVPFGSVSERLYRILRATAKELDKRANLEIRGAQTELDRSVLEKLVGPLEHLLRNAVAHGIERRAVRAKAGKSETGEITLTVRQGGNEIAIEFADDGSGLDLEGVRAKAVAQGKIAADAQPTDDQLIELIFEQGFSTAPKVTHVAGRGVGMDVVRSEIATLGGRVQVSTKAGLGTTFLLHLPLTLAVAQAVMVRAGGRLWALPAPMVEKIQHVKADALVDLYLQRRVEWQGNVYPFHYLPRLLGDTHQIPESGRHNSVLLLRSGQSLAAVHVDEMVGNQEVVVKNIGPQLARVSGIAGATVLGNGEIVLIINPVQLALRAGVPDFEPNAERVAPEIPRMAVAQAERPLVMIVDDSLTVRRITSRLLTREGFEVITAKDGIEALELLEAEVPDVILLDIEMPRMDGFEFAKTIKADPKNARIPIVMITSRTAEKHRNRAKELGVDLYLGKPFQEDELLNQLREMLALTP